MSRRILRMVTMLMAMVCLFGCGKSQPQDTAPTQTQEVEQKPVEFDLREDVRYFGRTYEKARIHWFNWSGSGFSVRFQGSSLVAEFYSNAPQTKDLAYLKVYIDGQPQPDILLREECQMLTLAEGLDPQQEHTLEVRKRTNVRSSSAGLSRLVLMDGTILEPEAPKQRCIEFVGDSLTVGYVASKEGKSARAWSTTTEDVTGTYCPQIAAAFDAQYQVVGVSGRGVVRNNGGDAEMLFPEIYRQLDAYNNPGVEYDFAAHPDVIVINLGTNDESAANENLPPEEFRQGLYDFLKEIRQYHPDAQILYTYGLVRTGLFQHIEAVVTQLQNEGDEKLHYLQLTQCEQWELNLNHTVSSAYASRGEEIIEKIREITLWE